MSVIRKDLPFQIPPMKGEDIPYVKPKVEQVSFRFKFIKSSKNIQFPPKINHYWNEILNGTIHTKFTDLFEQVKKCDNPALLMSAFSDAYQSESQLSLDLLTLVQNYTKVLPPQKLHTIFTPTHLNLKDFLAELPSPCKELFSSIVELTHVIIDNLPNYNDKMEVLSRTASALIPKSYKDEMIARPFLTILCLFPISDSNNQKYWLILNRDQTVQILNMVTKNVEKQFSLENVIVEVSTSDNSIEFEKYGSFKFTSPNMASIWKDAFNETNDALVNFLGCIPAIVQYKEHIPSIFYDQMRNLINSDVYDFTRCFGQVAVTKVGKAAFSNLLQYILYCGNVSTLVRYLFGIQITATVAENTIFRETSACSVLFSLIAENYGFDFIEQIVSKAAKAPNRKECAEIICDGMHLLPPQIRYLLAAVFRSTRRKFPDRLVPLFAISSMFMLRFVSPQLIMKGATRLAQMTMKAFVFYNGEEGAPKEDDIPQELYKKIAETYANVIQYEDPAYHVAEPNIGDIVADIATHNKELLDHLKKKPQEHPLYWSMLELLENVFIGEEDLMTIISQGYLTEQN